MLAAAGVGRHGAGEDNTDDLDDFEISLDATNYDDMDEYDIDAGEGMGVDEHSPSVVRRAVELDDEVF